VYDGLKDDPEATQIFEDCWNRGIHRHLSVRFLARLKAHDLGLMEKTYLRGSESEVRAVYEVIKKNPAAVAIFMRALDEERRIETSSRHLLEAIAGLPSHELPVGIENTLEAILFNDSIPGPSGCQPRAHRPRPMAGTPVPSTEPAALFDPDRSQSPGDSAGHGVGSESLVRPAPRSRQVRGKSQTLRPFIQDGLAIGGAAGSLSFSPRSRGS
jgi:hypothetical protein